MNRKEAIDLIEKIEFCHLDYIQEAIVKAERDGLIDACFQQVYDAASDLRWTIKSVLKQLEESITEGEAS